MKYVFQPFPTEQYRILEGIIIKKSHDKGEYYFSGVILKSTRDDSSFNLLDFECPIYDNKQGISQDFIYDSYDELVRNHFCEILQ